MSRVSFSLEQKRLIVKRDQHCVIHHHNYHPDFHYAACSGELAIHHRLNRGMGGSKSRNRVANGLLVCTVANGLMESNADYAAKARVFGWKIRTDNEVATVPVWVPWLQRSVYLNDEGQYLAEGTQQVLEVQR